VEAFPFKGHLEQTRHLRVQGRGQGFYSALPYDRGQGRKDEATLKQVLNPGQSGVLTVTFQKSGTYEMYCPVDGHEQMGMKGKVVVK
jgi:plastocyanin